MVEGHFWKNAFWTHSSLIFDPKTDAFQGILGSCLCQNLSQWAHNGLKTLCSSIPNAQGSLLENRVFDPILTLFWSQNDPFSRHFRIFHGRKRVTTRSIRAEKTWFQHPKWSGIIFGKGRFWLIFEPFFVPKRPIFKAFWGFLWRNTRHQGLEMGQKHFWKHPKWSRKELWKKWHFSPRGPWWSHRWPPPCAGRAALRLRQMTTGTGV